MPRVSLRTRVLLVLHRQEAPKPTNTGRLAVEMLANAEACLWSGRHAPWSPLPTLDPGRRPFLLFPPDERPPVPVADLAGSREPVTLVVPDGTWSHVQRIVRTNEWLLGLPRVALPAGAGPRRSLRAETRAGGMSTFDAISWALAGIEGEEAVAPLDAAYQVFFERTMAIRGMPVAGGPTIRDFPPRPGEGRRPAGGEPRR